MRYRSTALQRYTRRGLSCRNDRDSGRRNLARSFPCCLCRSSKHDVRLIPVFKADRVWNAVTTTRDGRVFVSYSSADRPGVQFEELSPNGVGRAYPDEAWNAWQPGHDPKDAFVRVNALRIGPDSDCAVALLSRQACRVATGQHRP